MSGKGGETVYISTGERVFQIEDALATLELEAQRGGFAFPEDYNPGGFKQSLDAQRLGKFVPGLTIDQKTNGTQGARNEQI